MQTEWNAIGYVISSKYRLSVLRHLSDGESTPTRIASNVPTSTTHISRALRELREEGLVSLGVPDEQTKNRVYELTDRGKSVWETIRANELSV